MGCNLSRTDDYGVSPDVVSLCKERKHYLRLAIKHQKALADAHTRYNLSFFTVAKAIRLFVLRHSSPSSPLFITFHPDPSAQPKDTQACEPVLPQEAPIESTQVFAYQSQPCEPVFSQQTLTETQACEPVLPQQIPSEPTPEVIACESSPCSLSSDFSEMEMEEEPKVCPYFFYPEAPTENPSTYIDPRWDFFDVHRKGRPEAVPENGQSSNETTEWLGQEEEIEKLENDENHEIEENEVGLAVQNDNEENQAVANESPEQKVLTVADNVHQGIDLLKALKDVEQLFIGSYASVKEVTKRLQANGVQLEFGPEDTQDNSTRFCQPNKWYQSPFSRISRSSSSRSLLSPSSKQSSRWAESKQGLFESTGGSGCEEHLCTLERLYAWETKLSKEVQVGDSKQKIYNRKCAELEARNVNGIGSVSMVKTKQSATESYSRMSVAIRTTELISKRIHNLRDQELQLQVIELLQGQMQAWRAMWEAHETQKKIMLAVTSFNSPSFAKFCDQSHRLATIQLEAELQNWCASFTVFVASQKAYVKALYGWVSRFLVPEVEFYSKKRALVPPNLVSGPLILMIFHEWLTSLEILPDKSVQISMKSFRKNVWTLSIQQEKEHQQKRKVEILTKELDRRALARQKADNKVTEHKYSGLESQKDVQNLMENLAKRTNQFNELRKRLDREKAKHHEFVQQTQKITLEVFQKGFSSVFKSLAEFSQASLQMYNELMSNNEKVKLGSEAENHLT